MAASTVGYRGVSGLITFGMKALGDLGYVPGAVVHVTLPHDPFRVFTAGVSAYKKAGDALKKVPVPDRNNSQYKKNAEELDILGNLLRAAGKDLMQGNVSALGNYANKIIGTAGAEEPKKHTILRWKNVDGPSVAAIRESLENGQQLATDAKKYITGVSAVLSGLKIFEKADEIYVNDLTSQVDQINRELKKTEGRYEKKTGGNKEPWEKQLDAFRQTMRARGGF